MHYLRFGGVATQADSQRGASLVLAAAHRQEDMGGANGSDGARRSRGDRYLFQIQRHHHVFTRASFHGNAYGIGEARMPSAVKPDSGETRGKLPFQTVPQQGDAL